MARLETQLSGALADIIVLKTRIATLETQAATVASRLTALEATAPAPGPTPDPINTSAFVATLLDAPDAAAFRRGLALKDFLAGPAGTLLQSGGLDALPVWRSLTDIAADLPAMPWSADTPPSP